MPANRRLAATDGPAAQKAGKKSAGSVSYAHYLWISLYTVWGWLRVPRTSPGLRTNDHFLISPFRHNVRRQSALRLRVSGMNHRAEKLTTPASAR